MAGTTYKKVNELPVASSPSTSDYFVTVVNNSAKRVAFDTASTLLSSSAITAIVNKQDKPTTSTATLAVASWNNNSQQVTVSGVTSSCIVQVSPDPGSQKEYERCGVYCTTQTTNKLTFQCDSTPANALTVNVLIWK